MATIYRKMGMVWVLSFRNINQLAILSVINQKSKKGSTHLSEHTDVSQDPGDGLGAELGGDTHLEKRCVSPPVPPPMYKGVDS